MADLDIQTQRLARLAGRLSRRGDCKLWLMHRYDLAVEPAPLRRPLPLRIGVAGANEMDAVAALSNDGDPERAASHEQVYRNRIDAGSLCFVARTADDQIVSYNWIRIGTAIGAHGVRMHFADHEIYTTDAYTVPAWRGHGLHPALNRAMLVHARRLGFRVAFTLVRADNERSAVALPRVGWQHVGTLLHWQPHGQPRDPVWRTCGEIHPMQTVAPEEVARTGSAGLADLLQTYGQRELVSVRPWSNLYRLSGDTATAYLKIVAPVQAPLMRLGLLLAQECAPLVTPVIAGSAADPAWLLMRDHLAPALDPLQVPTAPARARLLETVAAIQALAARRPLLLAAAPLLDLASVWPQLADELHDQGRLAGLIGLDAARAARAVLVRHGDRLQRGSAAAEALPLTIEHTKLGLDNAAFLPDGSCLVTSWNDALTAPAGVSLHRLFGGAARTLRVFAAAVDGVAGGTADAVEIDALRGYLDALVSAGYADRALLHCAMPGAIALGPAARLLALIRIDHDDSDQRLTLATHCTELLDQVIDLTAAFGPAAR